MTSVTTVIYVAGASILSATPAVGQERQTDSASSIDVAYEAPGPFSPSSATATISASSVPLAMDRQTKNEGIAEASLGTVYTAGDFGAGSNTTIWSTALGARVRLGNLALSASLPWMRIRSRSTIFTGIDATPVLVAPNTFPIERTVEGFGDLTLGASYSITQAASPIQIELSGRAKINTAAKSKGLSSGQNDYAVGADVSVPIGRLSPFASFSYRFLGNTPAYVLRDGPAASAGTSYAIDSRSFLLVSYHYSRAATRLIGDAHEVFAGASTRLGSSRLRLTAFGTAGLSRGAADVSTGVAMSIKMGKSR